jgi:hypothetical protein
MLGLTFMQVIAFDCILLILFNIYFELCELIKKLILPSKTKKVVCNGHGIKLKKL